MIRIIAVVRVVALLTFVSLSATALAREHHQLRAAQGYEGHWCRESGALDYRPLTISESEILAIDLSCKWSHIETLNKSVWTANASCADESYNYNAKLTFVLVGPSADPDPRHR